MNAAFGNGSDITGLNEIAAQLPEARDREKLLMSGQQHSMRPPLADFINGMGGNLTSVPRLSGAF